MARGKASRIPESPYDPLLNDFLLKNEIAERILEILNDQGPRKPDGWVSVPETVAELERSADLKKTKNMRSTVHYLCKRLFQKFKAIDKYGDSRPLYYRINEKGKTHLSKIREKRRGERK